MNAAPELFDIESLDINSLPYVLLENRADLPDAPGVYFVQDDRGILFYVGCSQSLATRWAGHDKIELFESISEKVEWVQIRFIECHDYRQIEAACIINFRPLMNWQIKGKGHHPLVRLPLVSASARPSQRADGVASIRVAPLLQWAVDLLRNLPEAAHGSRNPMWRDVAIAIAVVTGRRASEIMSSGKFELGSEPGFVLFHGHLKRHSNEAAAPYEIPVIGGEGMAHAVIDALQWLDRAGKRTTPESYAIATGYDGNPRDVENIQRAAAESHKRCSRYLSERVKEIFDDCVVVESGLLVDPDAPQKSRKADRRTMHIMRQVYAQLLPHVILGPGQKSRRQINRYLGHSERSSAMNVAASDDTDIEVIDGNVAAKCQPHTPLSLTAHGPTLQPFVSLGDYNSAL